MLDSSEHEISTVHKNQNAEKLRFLFATERQDAVFILLINVKMPTIYE